MKISAINTVRFKGNETNPAYLMTSSISSTGPQENTTAELQKKNNNKYWTAAGVIAAAAIATVIIVKNKGKGAAEKISEESSKIVEKAAEKVNEEVSKTAEKLTKKSSEVFEETLADKKDGINSVMGSLLKTAEKKEAELNAFLDKIDAKVDNALRKKKLGKHLGKNPIKEFGDKVTRNAAYYEDGKTVKYIDEYVPSKKMSSRLYRTIELTKDGKISEVYHYSHKSGKPRYTVKRTFDASEKLDGVFVYDRNVPMVKRGKTWDNKAKKLTSVTDNADMGTGKTRIRIDDGSKNGKVNFLDDRKTILTNEFHDNGNIKRQIYTHTDNNSSHIKYYDVNGNLVDAKDY